MNTRTSPPDFSHFWSLRYAAAGLPLTQLLSQRIGAVFAFAAARLELSPSAVTLFGAATFLVAALLYVVLPDTPGAVAVCLLVLQLGYGLDCADGQLARATNQSSKFGAWLDVTTDFSRNLLLSAAVIYWVDLNTNLPLWMILAGAFSFCIGIVIKLSTLTELRRLEHKSNAVSSPIRNIVLGFMDTATFLGVLALLRPWSGLLLLYFAAMGWLYLAIAVRQALARI